MTLGIGILPENLPRGGDFPETLSPTQEIPTGRGWVPKDLNEWCRRFYCGFDINLFFIYFMLLLYFDVFLRILLYQGHLLMVYRFY